MRRAAIIMLLGFLFFLLRFSLLAGLGLERFVHLGLVVILFFTIVFGRREGLIAAAVVGFVDHLYSITAPLGIYIPLYVALSFWVDYLLRSFFTNRSSYTLIVVSFLGCISFFILYHMVFLALYWLQWTEFKTVGFFEVLPTRATQSFVSSILVLFLYLSLRRLGIIFRNTFIYTGRKIR